MVLGSISHYFASGFHQVACFLDELHCSCAPVCYVCPLNSHIWCASITPHVSGPLMLGIQVTPSSTPPRQHSVSTHIPMSWSPRFVSRGLIVAGGRRQAFSLYTHCFPGMYGEVALHEAALVHALSRVQEGPTFPLIHHHVLLSCFLICVMLMNWGLDYNTLITGLTKAPLHASFCTCYPDSGFPFHEWLIQRWIKARGLMRSWGANSGVGWSGFESWPCCHTQQVT